MTANCRVSSQTTKEGAKIWAVSVGQCPTSPHSSPPSCASESAGAQSPTCHLSSLPYVQPQFCTMSVNIRGILWWLQSCLGDMQGYKQQCVSYCALRHHHICKVQFCGLQDSFFFIIFCVHTCPLRMCGDPMFVKVDRLIAFPYNQLRQGLSLKPTSKLALGIAVSLAAFRGCDQRGPPLPSDIDISPELPNSSSHVFIASTLATEPSLSSLTLGCFKGSTLSSRAREDSAVKSLEGAQIPTFI